MVLALPEYATRWLPFFSSRSIVRLIGPTNIYIQREKGERRQKTWYPWSPLYFFSFLFPKKIFLNFLLCWGRAQKSFISSDFECTWCMIVYYSFFSREWHITYPRESSSFWLHTLSTMMKKCIWATDILKNAYNCIQRNPNLYLTQKMNQLIPNKETISP